jgi:APA family basic amino acid/polyamine antiporter
VKFSTLFRKKPVEGLVSEASQAHGELIKSFNVTDLTLFGIAAIIGGGVFSTIGRAAYDGGPAIAVLYLGFAITCIFSAYCYARFASVVPVSGSAYTYAYTSLGEIVAWILGWNLVLEYAISNITVAISWSDYFTTLLDGFGLHVPDYLSNGYFTARDGALEADKVAASGQVVPQSLKDLKLLWEYAPRIGEFRLIMDVPALTITVLITGLVYVGIRESKNINNVLVVFKLMAIALVILAGVFYIKPINWIPFAPNGFSGVMAGVAAVSFAYIGFDSISTTAEESNNPQRDIPRAMMYALLVCTLLYILTVMVMTGMVSYKELRVGDPLAYIFQKVNMDFVAGIVSVGAVVATTSALLTYQIGQPRIWMVMSRDGLLPGIFSRIHPRFKTPSFSTFMTGVLVGIPSLFVDQAYVTDLTAIGTLFAFTLVCGGVLMMDVKGVPSKFKIPYLNGQYILPGLLALTLGLLLTLNPQYLKAWTQGLGRGTGEAWLKLGFLLFWGWLSVMAFRFKLSLIPLLGVLINLYLMTELGTDNWLRFLIWCLLGLLIYFGYGLRKSHLNAVGVT